MFKSGKPLKRKLGCFDSASLCLFLTLNCELVTAKHMICTVDNCISLSEDNAIPWHDGHEDCSDIVTDGY